MIYSVVLVSDIQPSESVIYKYPLFFLKILFPYRPLQSIEYSSLFVLAFPGLLHFHNIKKNFI